MPALAPVGPCLSEPTSALVETPIYRQPASHPSCRGSKWLSDFRSIASGMATSRCSHSPCTSSVHFSLSLMEVTSRGIKLMSDCSGNSDSSVWPRAPPVTVRDKHRIGSHWRMTHLSNLGPTGQESRWGWHCASGMWAKVKTWVSPTESGKWTLASQMHTPSPPTLAFPSPCLGPTPL